MFEESIKEGKPKPDFTGTDAHQVAVTLRGEIQNPEFLRFLEKIGKERLASFTTNDLLILDSIQRDVSLAPELHSRVPHLLEQGIIERIGRGRGSRLIFSQGLYGYLGKAGSYTRQKGLDRETNKALLLKHIQANSAVGSALPELQQVLPALSLDQVKKLLQELKGEGAVRLWPTTARRSARWYRTNQPTEGAGD